MSNISSNHINISVPAIPCVKKYVLKTIVTNKTIRKNNYYERKTEFHYLGNQKGLFRYQILCTDIDFNGETLESVSFFKKIGYVFDEVIISANKKGEILFLHNLTDLQNRWQMTKMKLLKDHEGNEMLNYFDSIDKLLNDAHDVVEFLKGLNMYGLFFNGYWGEHKKELITRERKIGNETISEIFCARINLGNEQEFSIQTNGTIQKKDFKGFFQFTENKLTEAVVETEDEINQIKYTLLCLGLKKV